MSENEVITNNFAINIRALRKKHKLTQKQLSEKLSKKESAVRMWELNKNEPSLTTLIKLAEIFEVTLDELVGVNA
ncbi:hypothetical protein BK128_08420 [Viridibacillus sp. FSL H7-0596]|uniref:helix-turn-helix domain-containing protein n=1 Tax=Viridibacillus sp. FSL H7-0596 TaxID=1928923 RepID=UPI00096ED42B|nr:helix-turn-helix transcriptional regulator [Viridibacillus sp. FSL H7-0596]OMC87441.1 hypothetical protein BK128_08420 [Viridibacillus sp. FSL H7-0596]